MIQDIAPSRLNNTYESGRIAKASDYVLHFTKDGVFVRTEHEVNPVFPKVSELSLDFEYIYLFSIDETGYFGIRNVERLSIRGFQYANVRTLRYDKTISRVAAFAAVTGLHLYRWYEDNRYCGRCGCPTIHHGKERAMECSGCGNVIYPRLIPAVIVGVTNGDALLVTKYREGFEYYALVAGFVEIGETLEEAVAREVMEETGLKVKNIRYYKSQPWGIVQDILAGFYCDVDGDSTIHMDEGELKVAKWAKKEEIILQPDDASLTNEMMQRFKEGMEPLGQN